VCRQILPAYYRWKDPVNLSFEVCILLISTIFTAHDEIFGREKLYVNRHMSSTISFQT